MADLQNQGIFTKIYFTARGFYNSSFYYIKYTPPKKYSFETLWLLFFKMALLPPIHFLLLLLFFVLFFLLF